MSRGDLMEVEWRILRVLLPVERKPGKQGRGRPPADNRNIINGILWRLRPVRRGAMCRKVREMELNLPTLLALVCLRCLGERGYRSRRDDGRERALRHRQHYGSRPCLGSGRERGIYHKN